MNATRFAVVLFSIALSGPGNAQGTNQGTNQPRQANTGVTTSRGAVSTQPSNNPFQNPIGQGVPPAASSNPTRNSNQSNVPLNTR